MTETKAGRTLGKWITAIPMQYEEGSSFWRRDMGLLALGMREAGIHARFVALGEGDERKELPLVLGTLSDLSNAEWWKQLDVQHVVLTAWGLPKYEPISRAIKQTGAKLNLILDTDGMISPRLGFGTYVKIAYSVSKDLKKPLPPLFALGKAVIFRAFSSAYESGFLDHISHADILLVAVPKAKDLLEEFFLLVKRPDLANKLRILPYPVASSFAYAPHVKKDNEIVCVGRWWAHQKDAPTLIRVLSKILGNKDYSATICGPGEDVLSKLVAGIPVGIQKKVRIAGPVANESLNAIYQRAQIFLVTSRHESFNIAAGEALCCGCTVVGPGNIPSMHYLTGSESGSLARSRSMTDLVSAVESEINCWNQGARNPATLSEMWIKRLHPKAVATRLLEVAA